MGRDILYFFKLLTPKINFFIIVMLPILESHLGFNAQMMSLITALYILFDPVITCANVLGNGGFAMVIDRLVAGLKKKGLL